MKFKHLFIAACSLISSVNLFAQDDLMGALQAEAPLKSVPVFATFKGPRIISGQSNESVAAKHLNFVILHRFGTLDGDKSYTDFLGFDAGTNMRLTLDYGVTNDFQIGIGRTNLGKTYDVNAKYKLFKQTRGGKKSMPFGLTYYGNVAINTAPWEDPSRDNFFTSRLTFFHQLILTRKCNDWLSLQIAPALVHRNLATFKNDPNDIYVLGLGASLKITRSTRFNIEYYPRLNGRDEKLKSGDKVYDFLGAGFDIETGGHVFQLMLTNGMGMLEQQMITNTTTSWSKFGIRLGFNLSRTFSFEKEQKKQW